MDGPRTGWESIWVVRGGVGGCVVEAKKNELSTIWGERRIELRTTSNFVQDHTHDCECSLKKYHTTRPHAQSFNRCDRGFPPMNGGCSYFQPRFKLSPIVTGVLQFSPGPRIWAAAPRRVRRPIRGSGRRPACLPHEGTPPFGGSHRPLPNRAREAVLLLGSSSQRLSRPKQNPSR